GAAVQRAVVPAATGATALSDLADAVATAVCDVGPHSCGQCPVGLPVYGAVHVVDVVRIGLAEIAAAPGILDGRTHRAGASAGSIGQRAGAEAALIVREGTRTVARREQAVLLESISEEAALAHREVRQLVTGNWNVCVVRVQ